jgi:RHS repeat-associated protein
MKRIYLLMIFLLFTSHIFAQNVHEGDSFVLDYGISGNQEYNAKEFISVEQGFSYSPSQTTRFVGQINPFIVTPPEGGETGGVNIGDNGIVGSIAGSFNVTDGGAATYAIPISVPPGINGMQPNLSISYSGQQRSGLCGMGWSISGFSAITRTGQNKWYDDNVRGVMLDSDDNFAIDGARLRVKNVLSGTSTRFVTATDNNHKIISYGTTANGPLYFKVWAPDGKIMYYGNTGDSRVEVTGGNVVLQWRLNRIEDVHGNYINIEYYENNTSGESYPVKVEYGEANSTNGFASVELIYEGKPDKEDYYIHTCLVKNRKRVKEILVKYENNLVNKYTLNYDFDFYSHLTSVDLEDKEGNRLNPLKFEWGDELSYITPLGLPELSYNDYNTNDTSYSYEHYTGDFNGDGKTDVFEARSYCELGIDKYDEINLFISNGTGFHSPITAGILQNSIQFKVGDFDGDNNQELIIVSTSGFDSDDRINYTYYDLENNILDVSPIDCTHRPLYEDNPFIDVGDFDGDGIDELILLLTKQGSNHDIQLFSLNNDTPGTYELDRVSNADHWLSNNQQGEPQFILTAFDFNGDGKTNFIKQHENGLTVFEWDNGNIWNSIFSNTQPDCFTPVFWADFNGDSKKDYIKYFTNLEEWELRINEGDDFKWDHCPITRNEVPSMYEDYIEEHNIQNGQLNNHYYIGDYNGDGLSDILEIFTDVDPSQGDYDVNVYYSANNLDGSSSNINCQGFQKEVFYNIPIGENNYSGYRNFNRMDLDGDGKEDFSIKEMYGTPQIKHFFLHKNEKKHYVHKITNSFGDETNVIYQTLSEGNDDFYSKNSGEQHPIVEIQAPLTVVKEVKSSNGKGGLSSTNYKYMGLRAHMEGKGLLGFSKIIITSPDSDLEISKTFCTDYGDVRYTHLWLLETKNISNNQLLESINYGYQYSTTSGLQKVAPRYEFVKKWDLDGSFLGTHKTFYIYDMDYQTLISKSELKSYADKPINAFNHEYEYETLSEFDYTTNDLTNWILNRVGRVTVSLRDPDNTLTEIDKNEFYYYVSSHNSYPLLKTSLSKPGNALSVKKEFEYDDYGNNIKVTTSAPNFVPSISPRVSTKCFGANTHFRFPELVGNMHNGQEITESYVYDEVTGNVIEHTGVDGLKTENIYDGFGRIIKTLHPDGSQTAYARRWVQLTDQNAPNEAIFYKWQATSGLPSTQVYYDSFNRILRSVTTKKNDLLCVDNEYNSKGQLIKTSDPYKMSNNSNIVYTQYAYDDFGRKQTITHVDGNQTELDYNGFVNTITAFGKTTTNESNIYGQVFKSTDPDGNCVINEFNLKGEIVSTYLQGVGSSRITIGYDDNGNRTLLNDPDAGTITSTYNPFGELIQLKNANNQVTTATYDDLGRKTQETNPDGQIDYTYVESGNGVMNLASISSSNHCISYDYDELGRKIGERETIQGAPTDYSYSYTYDAIGRVKSKSLPSGFEMIYHYNSEGKVDRISDVNNPNGYLWQMEEMDEKGRVADFALGNQLQTSYTFDDSGNLTDILTTNNQGAYVQRLNYEWSPNGNLAKRWDKRIANQRIETFTYDNLDRLLTVTQNSVIKLSMQYDQLGNITHKSGIGDFSYDNQKIHALTGIQNLQIPSWNAIDEHSITYNYFNKVSSITQGTKSLDIYYGHHEQRIKQVYENNSTQEYISKYYSSGGVEQVEDQSGVTTYEYLSSPAGTFAVRIIENNNSTLYYLHQDHLGSIVALSNETGQIVQEMSFNAWGERRNIDTWQNASVSTSGLILDRGFTGHEHLDAFGLINMNGRFYDPKLSRFLSPDPYVQMPGFSQNLNRYSYCLNNPLKYTDPSGEFLFAAAGVGLLINAMCWGAVIGAASYTIGVAVSDGGFDNWSWGQLGISMGMGALSGIAAAGIGSIIGNVGAQGIFGEVLRAHFHGCVQGIISGSFGHGGVSSYLSGSLGSIGGSLFGSIPGRFSKSLLGNVSFSAIAGGIGSYLSGADFWQGAIVGGTVGLLNHFSHANKKHKNPKIVGKKVEDLQKGINFIYNNSKSENCEIGLSELHLKDGSTIYYVTPWDSNDATTCNHLLTHLESSIRDQIETIILYHTHLSQNGPSWKDFNNNTIYRNINKINRVIASYVIGDSYIYKVYRHKGPVAPKLPNEIYGEKICPVNEWLNGNFIGR